MRTIERKIYNFNELNEDVQQMLIEKEREYQHNAYLESYLQDDMNYKAKELLNKYFKGATIKNVYYDLSYSQGCGAMIEFTINFEDINKTYNIVSDEELRFITDKGIVNNIEVNHNGSMYYHENSFEINYDNDMSCYTYDDVKEEYNIKEENFYTLSCRIDDLIYGNGSNVNDVCKFRKDIINMNKELTKNGYDMIENSRYIDIGFIKEFLNDYEYYENGDVYYEL